ncbi:thiaminase II [Paracoccus sp. MBLB3053]|uniref:Aminopyrimidine aminohydrolase n=1 Tax=Paracoccus aurantius TaxID=3073814 RepID=A0ABU2HP84_9RHOB|nr:thiaminase II [Paracoccus sp. MBLB3053]MDS9466851.1 thiaminase II [Paracoccus sp. MBLB3053]
MTYGNAFGQWRQASRPDWDAYTRHSFVEGMSDGSLPRADFLTYLVQDYLFLIHFSRAWALAVVKAGDLEEMRACSATVHALLDHEMSLHVQTCAAAGIDVEKMTSTPEAMTNIAYTRYVMDAGLSGDFLDLLAALMPCVLGYGEIGLRLARECAPDTPYQDWIATYSGEDYQQACRQAGQLLDSAIRKRLGDRPEESPRWAELAHRFATATRLEVAFWDLGRA